MGTRNLTAVFSDGEYRIAQYGQWDGYPSGQGLTILKFCRKNLANKKGRKQFAKKLRQTRFTRDETATSPFFTRDLGGEILKVVNTSEGEVLLHNSIDFAADSLFCEWAYVIDLDSNTLEAFEGFNQKPLPAGQRFSNTPSQKKGYYPVKLAGTWSLDELPKKSAFLAELSSEEEEDAAE